MTERWQGLASEWRSPGRVAYDELMALTNAVPLTAEKTEQLAPTLCARWGGGDGLLEHLRFHVTSNTHLKEFVTAGVALGFDDRFQDRSKQQRLSDLAPYYNRTGWRNMWRWLTQGLEGLAERMSGAKTVPYLFDVTVSYEDDCFTATVRFYKPDEDNGVVHNIDVVIMGSVHVEWKPVEDDELLLTGIQPTDDSLEFRVYWFTNADGRVIVRTYCPDWLVETRYSERSLEIELSDRMRP